MINASINKSFAKIKLVNSIWQLEFTKTGELFISSELSDLLLILELELDLTAHY